MTVLQKLVKRSIRYGLGPEALGPVEGPNSILADEPYLAEWLRFMRGWKLPATYGCTARDRERACREWDQLLRRLP